MCNSIYWNPEIFQSTRPGWGEAVVPFLPFRHLVISIHSPRVGRGAEYMPNMRSFHKFQSTRPGWGEAAPEGVPATPFCISIHSPRVGRGR